MARPDPITEVTDTLLAMTWRTKPMIHGYLGVRKASVKGLGLLIEKVKGGFHLVRAPVAAAAPETPAQLEVWEEYANAVDNFLRLSQEPPERDAYVRGLMAENLTPRAAADRIIANRAARLEQALEPEPADNVTWDSGRKRAVPAAEAPPEAEPELPLLAELPTPAPPQAVSPEAQEVTIEAAAAATVAAKPGAKTRTSGRKRKQPPLPWDVEEMPASFLPVERGHRLNPGPKVIELLARPGGVSRDELGSWLGWRKPPLPWFIRHWTRQAGRVADLRRQGDTFYLATPEEPQR